MLVKELLKMTETATIAEIAKELPVGEKKVRQFLKEIGCEPNGIGKRGWSYKGDNINVLEKSVEEFFPRKANRKINASNSNSNNDIKNTSKDENNNNMKNDIKSKSKKDDNMLSEIQTLIKGTNKDTNTRVYKGIYFDKDIAHFLDNVQHGNKSEIVNKILRQYLIENDLI